MLCVPFVLTQASAAQDDALVLVVPDEPQQAVAEELGDQANVLAVGAGVLEMVQQLDDALGARGVALGRRGQQLDLVERGVRVVPRALLDLERHESLQVLQWPYPVNNMSCPNRKIQSSITDGGR